MSMACRARSARPPLGAEFLALPLHTSTGIASGIRKSPGWDTPGDEKPGFVAWLLWGGNAAKNWSARKVKELDGERDLPEYDEERDIEEAQNIKVVVSADVTDFAGKIADLKATLLRTHLHGK